ncbi:MAG TPA: 4-(cytidine 5'-diphospho)-2-C-methyl-D-erythritol kinase [Alphaproteobacteria bacterium]|nr:4-(cytidine 5'-diphospho)-2-C-methyl-D-erythritol kinase [Alphaproteobacteria bacterium]
MITEFAPAKLNLYLHVTGRRADGYHDLDSLVAFAGVGDSITLEPSENFDFFIDGPQAGALANEPTDSNLAVRAAKALADLTNKNLNVKITLTKKLPIASGIGGGSSDAAATLRALAKHWSLPPNDRRILEAAAKQGQDVPVCLKVENNYMTATGTEPACDLPYADIVLVNPNKALPTPGVYKHYKMLGRDFSPHAQLKQAPKDLATLIAELKARSNDLTLAAIDSEPMVGSVLKALEATDNCLLSRMSGSGATCFGFYADRNAARNAASQILAAHPDWWVVQSYIPCRSDPRQNY